jgi:hypothetical protein
LFLRNEEREGMREERGERREGEKGCMYARVCVCVQVKSLILDI